MKGRWRYAAGFTLIELMAAVLIAAILAAIAAPSFSKMVAYQRMKTVATDLYVAITMARSEALKRNTRVTLSPIQAGAWQSGWQIPDPTNSTQPKILIHNSISGVTIAGPTNLTYRTSGRIAGATVQNFDISTTGTTARKCVSIDPSGRPYIKNSIC